MNLILSIENKFRLKDLLYKLYQNNKIFVGMDNNHRYHLKSKKSLNDKKMKTNLPGH
jgi:hypothetical protein